MGSKTEKRVTLSQPPFSEGPCANLLFSPTPGWRNWQTQRTQNPPVLSTLGVQLPLPAPSLNNSLRAVAPCSLAGTHTSAFFILRRGSRTMRNQCAIRVKSFFVDFAPLTRA